MREHPPAAAVREKRSASRWGTTAEDGVDRRFPGGIRDALDRGPV
jgi:hypothetical protein